MKAKTMVLFPKFCYTSNMIITTSLRENKVLIARAQELAHELGLIISLVASYPWQKCLERFGPFYLLYKDRLSFVNSDGSELSFHPDTAVLRIKRPHRCFSQSFRFVSQVYSWHDHGSGF